MTSDKQKQFIFPDNVMISSKFQSGNLSQVIQKSYNQYHLWIGSDHFTNYKTWFYFYIQGIQPNTMVTFTINNMNNQLKLFKQGHLPVFKQQGNQNWQRIKIPIQQNGMVKAQDGFQLTFKHFINKNCKYYFAFSYPFSTKQCDQFINKLIQTNQGKIFSSYKDLTISSQKRFVKLLTITKFFKGQSEWNQTFIQIDNKKVQIITSKQKKGIFISARVHPGQVASSHIMNGIIKFLFSQSNQAQKLLQKYIFYLIPIINPDGVDQGNFRTDCKGKNLNRFYTDPNAHTQPQIYTIKKFLMHMIQNNFIQFCLDLHAHVNKQGAFIYGNSIPDLKGQIEVCLFPKILAYNCQYFDYDACNFSQKNMASKDKSDQLSKQGASRVAIYKQTGLKACWTLECNYNSCKIINQFVKPQNQSLKNVSNGVLVEKLIPKMNQQKVFLGIKQFQQIGKNICQSILDFYGLRKEAKYFSGKIKNRQNFIINLAVEALRMIPFRFDNNCRKLLTGINGNINISDNLNKIKEIISDFKVCNNINLQKKEFIKNQNIKKSNQIISYQMIKQTYSVKQIQKKQHPKSQSIKQRAISINKVQSGNIKPKDVKKQSLKLGNNFMPPLVNLSLNKTIDAKKIPSSKLSIRKPM